MSPRTPEQNRAAREQTRHRILEAALTLFDRVGYEQTSVKQIAETAQIAQGLLYQHFAGKEQLLYAIFEECSAQVRLSFAAGEGEEAEADQRLAALIRRAFTLVRDGQDFWRLTYAVRLQPAVLAGLSPLLAESVTYIEATLRRYFEGMNDANPELSARVLFALIDGTAQHFVLAPATYPLDDVADEIIRRFCPPE